MRILGLILMIINFQSCDLDTNNSKDNLDGANQNEDRTSPRPGDQADIPPRNLPTCQKYCEKYSTHLNKNDDGYSYLSFVNFGYRGIGRCRGHALVTQKFSVMARFNRGKTCDLNLATCMNAIKAKIDDVLNFKMRYFGNFKNLYELSQIKELKNYLYNKVKNVPHKYRATPSKIPQASYPTRALNVYHEVSSRSQKGHLPYVGVKGALTGSHALLIYDTGFVSKRDVLCVRDPNLATGYMEDCQNYVYVEQGRVYYKRYDRRPDFLSFFQLTNDEDLRVKRYSASLYKTCLKRSVGTEICK